jgi:hypothetical protein
MPQLQAASVRDVPSTTKAIASKRRDSADSELVAASRRNSDAV